MENREWRQVGRSPQKRLVTTKLTWLFYLQPALLGGFRDAESDIGWTSSRLFSQFVSEPVPPVKTRSQPSRPEPARWYGSGGRMI